MVLQLHTLSVRRAGWPRCTSTTRCVVPLQRPKRGGQAKFAGNMLNTLLYSLQADSTAKHASLVSQ